MLSELDFANALRVRRADAVAFFAALERDWELAETFDSYAPSERFGYGGAPAPHDWLYPHPQIRVYRIRADRADPPPASAAPRSGAPSR